MVTIINLKDIGGYSAVLEEYQILIDRNSIFGNPYKMEYNTLKCRNDVCDKYNIYFKNKINTNNILFLNELNRLINIHNKYGKLELCCWCYPKRCHGEIIKDYLNEMLTKQ